MGGDGRTWHVLPGCGSDLSITVCHLDTNTLLKEPYNLHMGDYIQTRAKANNFCGWSDYIEVRDAQIPLRGLP